MKTILIPLDGSKLGEEALSVGLGHYPASSTQVILLHTMDINHLYYNAPMLPRDFRELDEAERKRFQDYLDEQVTRLKDRGYDTRSVIAWGEPADRIVAVAQAQKADLILLTTHGRTGVARLFLGSVAEGVVRRATVPVLVIPSSAKEGVTRAEPEGNLQDSCRTFMEEA